jgi:polar amino acid transport system substrate-binding protein
MMRVRGVLGRGFALLAIMVAVTIGAEAQQKSTLDAVKTRGALIAGVKTDYPPFGYIDESGKTVGFDIDLVTYIADRLGVKLDLRPVTSANRIPMLMNDTVDLIAASTTITQEREEVVDFSVPYIVIGGKFLVRSDADITGYSSLAGKTVTYTQGTPWGEKIKAEQTAAKHLVFQDKPQAVLALLQGKADAYVDDAAPLAIFARQHAGKLKVVGEASRPLPMGIAVRPNDSKWRDTINLALIAMWDDGTWHKLYQKHLGVQPEVGFIIYNWKL